MKNSMVIKNLDKIIPITNDRLLALGFKPSWHESVLRISITDSCAMTCYVYENKIEILIGDDVEVSHIKHVHELIELYRCLTGRELTLAN